ncbi:MAG: iron-sulfur cluster assembly scaffold protein [Desulfobacterales bacterium]|nr:iron-sulfur cluster assembly scaffold protein [Desulfobacterales bacterium]MDJ0912768.1 iron-sulfur cluster assembly scaffold protein [Desulfobacterales bacterium]
MAQNTSDFWQEHSLRFLEMAFRTDKRERLTDPDGYGKNTGDCGDTVEMFLKIRNGLIQAICFDTNGCLNTNACANGVAYLTEGRSLNDAWRLKPENVSQFLETLPPDHFHCAELAVGALYRALADYRELQRQPYKRLYQKKR